MRDIVYQTRRKPEVDKVVEGMLYNHNLGKYLI
jgi:hypothetical protein